MEFKEAEYLKEKREKAIEYLGNKWILAKVNYIKKKPESETKGVLSK